MRWQSEQDTSLVLCVLAFQLCRLKVAFAVWHLRQMRDLACAGMFLMSMNVLKSHVETFPAFASAASFSGVSGSTAKLPGPWQLSQLTSGRPDSRESCAPIVDRSKSLRIL